MKDLSPSVVSWVEPRKTKNSFIFKKYTNHLIPSHALTWRRWEHTGLCFPAERHRESTIGEVFASRCLSPLSLCLSGKRGMNGLVSASEKSEKWREERNRVACLLFVRGLLLKGREFQRTTSSWICSAWLNGCVTPTTLSVCGFSGLTLGKLLRTLSSL